MIFTNFREIDSAGRIVISKDIRNYLDIKAGDMLHIEADNDCICIKKAEQKCIFCNSSENLKSYMNKCVCADCIKKLQNNQ